MARGYDTRPDLEGYDALTVRGVAKFVLIIGVLFGAQFLADHYGLGRWLKAAILLAGVGIGLKVVWIGINAWKAEEYPPNADVGPRYADQTLRFVSPRSAATGEILGGAIILADSVFKLIQILSE